MKTKWIQELKRSISTNSQFMLWGNIYDLYPLKTENGALQPLKLSQYLAEELSNEEYHLILYYEPVFGLSMLVGEDKYFNELTGKEHEKDQPLQLSLNSFIELLEKINQNKEISVATIFNYTSRITESCKQDMINEFYYRMFNLLHTATPKKTRESTYVKYNPVIFLLDKENDMPAWYATDNSKIKSIPVPKPDYYARESIIKHLSKRINGFNELELNKRTVNELLFIEQTNGLYISEILSIISLSLKENVDFSNIGQAINMYKLGIIENQWSKVPVDKLNRSDKILAQRVMGQPVAVNKVADILKRAYFNLSGSQYSKNSNRPKGVMFFAGPTGVGKTELAKAVTELVFGSENNYIRFDMSEFSQENANQRLVGAPPGYVGYETGGELTNAVKENPFTVILFDEIEKAHPRIMDIFLQILDDGRLTSGRGETVYLSETIIIFTSNLGVYDTTENNQKIENITINMSYDEMSNALRNSIFDHFKYRLQRPEILNRIGENLIIFDYIRETIGDKIFNKMLMSILDSLSENHKISIEINDAVLSILQKSCLKNLDMGGRGIGNQLEDIFINPLSRILFQLNAQENDTLIITKIIQEDTQWKVEAVKKSI